MWHWLRRYGEVVGIVTGPLISLVSLGLLLVGVSQLGLPVMAWLAIGDAIFLVSGAALIYDAHKERLAALAALKLNADRTKHLHESRDLAGETFYVWELFEPDLKPLVKDRTFTDCEINGPAIITPMDSRLEHCDLASGNIDEVLYQMSSSPGVRQGIFGFVNCTFRRCQFRRVGFYGDEQFLADLRKSRVV
jgi:hypothetical protein